MTLDQKLLLYAQQFEDQHAPENITTTLREASAEIARLRAALESIKDMTDYGTETATWRMTSAIHNVNVIARAALEGRT